MTEQEIKFPKLLRDIQCEIISFILDNREQMATLLLSEGCETRETTEYCIPIAISKLLGMNRKANLEEVKIFKEVMWSDKNELDNLSGYDYKISLSDKRMLLSSKYGFLPLIKYLYSKGVDRALHIASENGHSEVVKYLESLIK